MSMKAKRRQEKKNNYKIKDLEKKIKKMKKEFQMVLENISEAHKNKMFHLQKDFNYCMKTMILHQIETN